jgi:uncharacterized phage-associated protein
MNNQGSPALHLAEWILERYPYRALDVAPLTHLKLQKLCFFAAGCAWACGEGAELADIRFEAWKHGPVLRDVYVVHREQRGELRPSGAPVEPFVAATERALLAALRVYGPLSGWALREQSHLEAPWADAKALNDAIAVPPPAIAGPPPVIENEHIRRHFAAKLHAPGGVAFPEYLVDAGVFRLDGIPFSARFADLHELADHVERAQRAASLFESPDFV